MSAKSPELIDPMDLNVPYYDLALSLLITMQSLATYCIDPSSIYFSLHMPIFNGGFGTVQQATLHLHDGSATAVAVKKLRPAGNDIQRLRTAVALAREVKVWAGLDHPNIAPLFGYHLDMRYDCAWLISGWEFLGDLKEYLANIQPDQETRLRLALDTARGLAYLHDRSPAVCHGDIKLVNVLVNLNRTAMWCDFGLAQVMDCIPSGLTTSRTNNGTTRYLSAEVLNGETGRTLKADVWAWGCVFFEVMTDRIPYESERSDFSVVLAIAQGKLPAPIETLPIPDFGKHVLAKCWSLDADLRPTMTWSSEVLAYRTTALFNAYCHIREFTTIPLGYKSEGDGWQTIRNPDSVKTYEFEFRLRFPHTCKIAFSPNNEGVAIVSQKDGKVTIFNIESGQKERSEGFGSYDVYAICFSHSGSLLATGHGNGDIRVWNLPMMTLRWQTRSHRRCVMSITFLHADTILASTFLADDSLCSWNVEKGTFLHNICVQEVQRVIASPHHPFVIAVTSQDATVCDVEVGRHLALPKYARAATFMPDGSAFVTGGHDNRLSTWSLQPLLAIQAREANRQITLLPGQGPAFVGITSEGPQFSANSVSISSDGRLAVSVYPLDKALVLWDLATGQPVLRMTGSKLYSICDATFCPGSTSTQGSLAYVYDVQGSSTFERVLQFVHYKQSS